MRFLVGECLPGNQRPQGGSAKAAWGYLSIRYESPGNIGVVTR